MVMNKKRLLTFAIVGIAALFFMAGVYAKDVPDMIKLNDPAYKKHKKGIVDFTHEKHQTEYAEKYPEFYKNGCGDCHHDKDNKPLSNLKEGDPVQKCIECHKIPSEVPKKLKKEWREKKVKKAEQKKKKLEYHAEALHINCRDCHKAFNKKYKPKKAPTTCAKCHPKKKK
ncbi:MAG: cytochrome c3 family protein [Hyphomicrobiaceae bacterium]|nr:cytochrome c3 family protein [Hyphomicrobiaceae bacterium]